MRRSATTCFLEAHGILMDADGRIAQRRVLRDRAGLLTDPFAAFRATAMRRRSPASASAGTRWDEA